MGEWKRIIGAVIASVPLFFLLAVIPFINFPIVRHAIGGYILGRAAGSTIGGVIAGVVSAAIQFLMFVPTVLNLLTASGQASQSTQNLVFGLVLAQGLGILLVLPAMSYFAGSRADTPRGSVGAAAY